MPARQLISRFPHTCPICNRRNEEETRIWYDSNAPRGRKAWCLEHGKDPHRENAPVPPPQLPQPGVPTPPATPAPAKEASAWRHHASAAEFVAWQETTPFARQVNRTRAAKILRNAEGQEHVSWLGVPTVAAVRKAVAEGWPEGVAQMQKALAQLANIPAPRNVRRTRIKADEGDALDIHAVYRGDILHAWTRCAKREGWRSRNVRLVADVLDNCNTTAQQIFWRGAAVLRLADALQEAGYNVEIWAAGAGIRYAATPTSPAAMLQTICVKPATAPLDLNALASTLCLTGFMRVWGFLGIIRAADEKGKDVANDLGRHVDLAPYMPDEPNQFVTPTLNNAEEARHWIEATLASMDRPTGA